MTTGLRVIITKAGDVSAIARTARIQISVGGKGLTPRMVDLEISFHLHFLLVAQ